jgi:hypothetical protein
MDLSLIRAVGLIRPRRWKEGPDAAQRGTQTSSRRLIPASNPTAVCFLFDTAFLWSAKSGNSTILPLPELAKLQKECLIDKIRADGGVSRCVPLANTRFPGSSRAYLTPLPPLINVLQVVYSPFIAFDFFLYLMAFRCRRSQSNAPLHTGKWEEVRRMDNLNLGALSLIPVGLAVAFMVWAFWNFYKASGRR